MRDNEEITILDFIMALLFLAIWPLLYVISMT